MNKQRTKRRALARLVEIVEEQCPKSEDAHLCVMQADAMEEAEALSANLRSRMNLSSIPIYELPPAIVVHAGPKAMAVGLFCLTSSLLPHRSRTMEEGRVGAMV